MKLKKQRKVLEKSARLALCYGGSYKKVKGVLKSRYKRMPARTVARLVRDAEVCSRVERIYNEVVGGLRRYGVGVTEMHPMPFISGQMANVILTDLMEGWHVSH